jgi:hypothetical protein
MKLRICRSYGAKCGIIEAGQPGALQRVNTANVMIWRNGIKIALLLVIVSVCLFGYVPNSKSAIFREFEGELLSVQWMPLVCLAVWFGTFIFLTFSLNDLPLIGLLLIAIVAYFIS